MNHSPKNNPWPLLNHQITTCTRCPRLITHCQSIAHTKRRAYADHTYWAKPVPNLGDPNGHLLIVGLAPGAHGANRTGRMFTGDRSGDFLFAAMHATGYANQPTSTHISDDLALIDCVITASAHCAPPDNKPTPQELANCSPFLLQTITLMPNLNVILMLGRIAMDQTVRLLKTHALIPADTQLSFAHCSLTIPKKGPALLCSYHPSQQNTFTKKLTQPMLQAIFTTAHRCRLVASPALNLRASQ